MFSIHFVIMKKSILVFSKCVQLLQVARTDSELTRMRAAMEKGEAVRQNLEYELAKLRREVGQEKRSAGERETLLADVNDSMKRMYTNS